jgi:hypothetical protein
VSVGVRIKDSTSRNHSPAGPLSNSHLSSTHRYQLSMPGRVAVNARTRILADRQRFPSNSTPRARLRDRKAHKRHGVWSRRRGTGRNASRPGYTRPYSRRARGHAWPLPSLPRLATPIRHCDDLMIGGMSWKSRRHRCFRPFDRVPITLGNSMPPGNATQRVAVLDGPADAHVTHSTPLIPFAYSPLGKSNTSQ